ncbi:MAG: hypothetical protein KF712_16505 [Akkermansiaceae bacterium]|nr:hypothetical protein [Akkermansiaceae bacterium]
MIKSEETTAADRTGTRISKCYLRNPDARTIKFEPLNADTFVFPYQHLIYASLGSADETEVLTVVFVSHEVTIRGRQLQSLLKVFQELAVESVCVIPARYSETHQESSATIEQIAIRSKEEPQGIET